MKFTSRYISMLIGGLLLLAAVSTQAAPINVEKDGVAIKGYDTVAYFTQSRPIRGKEEFQHTWKSAKWLFSNQEHLTLFKKNPESYAPQFGGY